MTLPATHAHEDDVLGKAYDGRLMRRLLVYARPYRALMYSAFALLCVEGGVQVVGPLLTRRVIDVAVPARDAHTVVICTVLFFGALVIEFLTSYGQTWLTSLLGQRVMRDLRMEIFRHLQRLSVTYFDRNPVGRLITRVTSDVETLNELFTSGVVSGLGDLFTLVAISVAMLIMDWRMALWSFAVIPFVVLVSGLFRKGVRETYRDIRVRIARINAFMQERLTGMRIVQLFGQENREARRFDELNREHLDSQLKSITVYALYFPAIELLTSIALAVLIVAGASRVHANLLTVGTVAAFLQHSADGDGELGKDLHATGHGAVRAGSRSNDRRAATRRRRRGPFRGRLVRLRPCSPGPTEAGSARGECSHRMGSQGGQLRCATGRDHRARRTYRCRKDDDRQPVDAIL